MVMLWGRRALGLKSVSAPMGGGGGEVLGEAASEMAGGRSRAIRGVDKWFAWTRGGKQGCGGGKMGRGILGLVYKLWRRDVLRR